MDLEGRGRGAGAEGERGGEWEAGSRRRGGAGDLIPRLVAGEGGSVGTRPVPTRIGGTGEGDAVRGAGPAGPASLAAGQGDWAVAVRWVGLSGPGGFPAICFFLFSFLFSFCFKSF